MKVQGPNGINRIQAYQNQPSHKEAGSASSKNKTIDDVQISSQAQSLLAGENSDPAKVERIKKAVEEGTYQVNSRAVAEKIYNSWFQ